MTEDVVNKLQEVFALDGSVEEACYYADISRETYYNWLERNPEYVDRFESLRNRPVLKARQTVVKSLDNPDHAFRYLEKKRKKEFGNALDLTSGNKPIPLLNALCNNNSNEKNSESNKEN